MYRIVPAVDHDRTLDTTATIDHAILRAKKFTDPKMDPMDDDWPNWSTVLIFDGLSSRMGSVPRVRVTLQKAFWLVKCTRCRKSGYDGFDVCKDCSGLGFRNERECQ
jgi:hypothetical protein